MRWLVEAAPPNLDIALDASQIAVALIGGIFVMVAAGIAGAYAIKSARIQKRMDAQVAALQSAAARDIRVELDLPQELINQYQEMTLELREEVAALRGEVKDLKCRVVTGEQSQTAYRNFAWQLVDHINNKLGPPPPPWPAGLA